MNTQQTNFENFLTKEDFSYARNIYDSLRNNPESAISSYDSMMDELLHSGLPPSFTQQSEKPMGQQAKRPDVHFDKRSINGELKHANKLGPVNKEHANKFRHLETDINIAAKHIYVSPSGNLLYSMKTLTPDKLASYENKAGLMCVYEQTVRTDTIAVSASISHSYDLTMVCKRLDTTSGMTESTSVSGKERGKIVYEYVYTEKVFSLIKTLDEQQTSIRTLFAKDLKDPFNGEEVLQALGIKIYSLVDSDQYIPKVVKSTLTRQPVIEKRSSDTEEKKILCAEEILYKSKTTLLKYIKESDKPYIYSMKRRITDTHGNTIEEVEEFEFQSDNKLIDEEVFSKMKVLVDERTKFKQSQLLFSQLDD